MNEDKALLEKYHYQAKFTQPEINDLVRLINTYVDPSFKYKPCCKEGATIGGLKTRLYNWYLSNKETFETQPIQQEVTKKKNGK